MSKYVIKNCSACHNYYSNIYECHQMEDCDDNSCSNYTDCVMKRIVELCNGIKCPCKYKGADCWECTESGARRFADKILKLLDIQEVE